MGKCFDQVRNEKMGTVRRAKEVNPGVVRKLFEPGDLVRIRLVSLHAVPGQKLRRKWSEHHKVLEVNGCTVHIENCRTGVKQWLHSDRLSTPWKFVNKAPPKQPKRAFWRQPKQTETGDARNWDFDVGEGVVETPEEPYTTRRGRRVKTRRDPDFDYWLVVVPRKEGPASATRPGGPDLTECRGNRGNVKQCGFCFGFGHEAEFCFKAACARERRACPDVNAGVNRVPSVASENACMKVRP